MTTMRTNKKLENAIVAIQVIIDSMIENEVIKTPDDLVKVVRETKYMRATVKLALRATARAIHFEIDPDYDNGIGSIFIPDVDDIWNNVKAAKRDMHNGQVTIHYVDLGNDAHGKGSFLESPVRTEVFKLH